MLIEQLVLEYVKTKLNNQNVFVQLPDTLPDKFVIMTISDRGKVDQINAVTMEIGSYSKDSKYDAAVLDESVRKAMEDITGDRDVSCRYGGGNDSPDSTLKMHRYRSYFNLYF